MCGIAGVSPPGRNAHAAVQAMLDAIAHRGPDGSGMFVDGGVAMGHCRLAIIDLAGGAQPRVDEATGDALTFNGEIYGHRALADDLTRSGVVLRDGCDTEVLFHLIRRDGVRRALDRIGGMFAFAYRDGRTGDLYLARDRYGEKPLYFGVRSGQIVFGSEAGAVLAHPAFRGSAPDLAAAYQLLQFEWLPGDRSGWTGIHKLRPGALLRFAGGKVEAAQYWRPQIGGGPPVRAAEAVDRLDALLQAAVARQCVADVPLGVFLSGGLDSSLLTALAARHNPGLTALTVQVGSRGFDETPYAAEVARHLGVAHQIVRLDDADVARAADALAASLSEPLADSSLLPTWLVCRAARARMTVALGGDGADELFAGYPNFQAQRLAGLMRLLPAKAGAALAAGLARLPAGGYMALPFRLAQLSHGFGQPVERQSALWMAPFGPAGMAQLWAPGVDQDALRQQAFGALPPQPGGGVDGLLHAFLAGYLPHDILTKTDRAAMFNGLEVRAPFLDREFAGYAAALPTRMKLRGRTAKWALKQVARRYLPDGIVDRRKHGFGVPIGSLLRTVLRDRCRDTVLSRRNPAAAWFRREALERMVAEHMSGTRDHGKPLWALHVLFTVAGRQPAGAPPASAARPLTGMPA